MKRVLNNILMQSGLIVPIDKQIIEILEESCYEFVHSDLFSYEEFENLIDSYINNSESKNINYFVANYIKDKDFDAFNFPRRVKCALVFYCIYIAIIDCDDEREMAIRSLSLQNAMILKHGKWSDVKYQDLLHTLYYKYNEYSQDKVIGDKSYPYDFVKSMFVNGYRCGEMITDDMARNIHSLSLLAWRSEMEQFIQDLDEKDPFQRVVLILEHYFICKPQILTLKDSKNLCLMLFSKGNFEEKQKLRDTIQRVSDSGIVLVNDVQSKFSVLLHVFNNIDSIENNDCLYDIQLSPKEFFVYLYHELLLEDLLSN